MVCTWCNVDFSPEDGNLHGKRIPQLIALKVLSVEIAFKQFNESIDTENFAIHAVIEICKVPLTWQNPMSLSYASSSLLNDNVITIRSVPYTRLSHITKTKIFILICTEACFKAVRRAVVFIEGEVIYSISS